MQCAIKKQTNNGNNNIKTQYCTDTERNTSSFRIYCIGLSADSAVDSSGPTHIIFKQDDDRPI